MVKGNGAKNNILNALALVMMLASMGAYAGLPHAELDHEEGNKDNGKPPCNECSSNGSPKPESAKDHTADPINIKTGNVFHSESVYATGGENPIRFGWYYNSRFFDDSGASTVIRGRWRHTYSRTLIIDEANISSGEAAFELQIDNGRSIWFLDTGTNPGEMQRRDKGVLGSLASIGTDPSTHYASYEYKDPDGVISVFDGEGRLTEVRDPSGRTLTFTYTDVSGDNRLIIEDHYGKQVILDYSGNDWKHPVKLTTPDNTEYTFSYTTQSGITLLSAIGWPDYQSTANNKQFVYELDDTSYAGGCAQDWLCKTAMTGVVDEEGSRYSTWSYTNLGRAWENYLGSSSNKVDHVTLDQTILDQHLTDNNNTRVVYHRYGQKLTYYFRPWASFGFVSGSTGNATVAKVEAENTENVSFNPWSGVYINYSYNGTSSEEDEHLWKVRRGNEEKKYYWDGNPDDQLSRTANNMNSWTTLYEWDASLHRLKKRTRKDTHGQGRSTDDHYWSESYTYDSNGRIATRTVEDLMGYDSGLAFTQGLGAHGQSTQTWTYSYTYHDGAEQQVATMSIDGPLSGSSDTTTYTYNTDGYLTQVTNAEGHATQYSNFNDRGQPGTITDPNGVVTMLSYAPRGWLTARAVDGETTSYEYYLNGLLKKVTGPDGDWRQYTYNDGHQLVEIENHKNETIEISRTVDRTTSHTETVVETVKDDLGNVVRSSTRIYDALGRLYKESGNNGQLTEYNYYHDNPQKLKFKTEYGHAQYGDLVQTYDWDVDGNLKKLKHANNDFRYYSYLRGKLWWISGANSQTNKAFYFYHDGLGRLIREVGKERGCIDYFYDDAGNLIRKRQTKYTTGCDVNPQDTHYEYDDLGRLTRKGHGIAPVITWDTDWVYDSTDPQHGNSLGRLSYITDPSGRTDYSYDAQGNIVSETRQITAGGNTVNLTTQYAYTNGNRLTQITYPGGRVVNLEQSSGDVTALKSKASAGATEHTYYGNIEYAAYGGWTQMALPGHQALLQQSYDTDGRLTEIRGVDQTGEIEDWWIGYSYDKFNQVTARTRDDSNGPWQNQYTYDERHRLITASDLRNDWEYVWGADNDRDSRILRRDGQIHMQEDYSYSNRRVDAVTRTVYQVPCTENCSEQTTRNLSYDDQGNLIDDDRGADTGIDLQYNNDGRLESVTPQSP